MRQTAGTSFRAGADVEGGESDLSREAASVRVNIFNQTYSLRAGSGDGAHVLRVARLVDERMRAIASGLAVHDVTKVAVLTALNLADELEGLRDFYETELRGMLERARAEEADEVSDEPDEPAAAGPTVAASAAVIEPYEEPPAEPPASGPSGDSSQEEPSWFEAIFDTDAPPAKTGEDRLSSQVSSRLRSQVSARLRRLRQTSPANSIMEEKEDEQ